MYKEIRPHHLLMDYVDAYWVSTTVSLGQQRILPDTCADIIFNIGEEIITIDNGDKIAPHTAFAVGTMTAFQDSQIAAGTQLLGIRFRPGGLYAFIGLPLQLITDIHLPLKVMAGNWHTLLEPILAKERSVPAKIRCLEKFLLQQLPEKKVITGSIHHTITQIQQSKGNVAVEALAASVFMSPRNFERHFLQTVGVSPKKFSRIVRFIAIKQQLKGSTNTPLLSLALENGFYDHAHLTREFSAFAGVSPTTYLQRL
ncbi:MAG: AraC family transcriptional regulator [Chitinophaga sp.]|uniref:AraC family transcriptional regulator n=1 Tax=Chitinophaga sp. TaxID=1869181 RepID=UPI001B079B7C|nr:helix-turn-helix domain-containing protein [Chitinophaga sp.]MBO9727202.1 AraC family transcriptional regulator [Chitinophaga sp.]